MIARLNHETKSSAAIGLRLGRASGAPISIGLPCPDTHMAPSPRRRPDRSTDRLPPSRIGPIHLPACPKRIEIGALFLRCAALTILLVSIPLRGSAGPASAAAAGQVEIAEREPATPRESFNAGTRKLAEGKLRESEALLERVLSAQEEKWQPPALYNLGHARFRKGAEELQRAPGGPAIARGRRAAALADQAILAGDDALRGSDVQGLIAAYLNGRGVQRELKAARAAVERALQTHGAALREWQRSSGDFKSAVELKPPNPDARHNADVVDRSIARLVDTITQLQQMAAQMACQNKDLGDKLKQLKGRIPDQQCPPGAAGDDEEEEEQPKGHRPGQQEAPSKEGDEMRLSPEQAGWLLEGYRLDGDRRLPMVEAQESKPRERNRPVW
jgi:hypothetical protein